MSEHDRQNFGGTHVFVREGEATHGVGTTLGGKPVTGSTAFILENNALNVRIAALESELAAEREAVRVLARVAYSQANRERLIEMDPNSRSPEVVESQIKNGLVLINALADAANNPIARAALEALRREGEEKKDA